MWDIRYCINAVYASPVRRGKAEIIEDIMPLYHLKFAVKVEETVKKVYLPFAGTELEFTVKDGEVSFTVPEMCCHTTVVIEY